MEKMELNAMYSSEHNETSNIYTHVKENETNKTQTNYMYR